MIRVMAPDGTLGEIPDERLAEALSQGAKIVHDGRLAEDLAEAQALASRPKGDEQRRAALYTAQHVARLKFDAEWKKKHAPLRRPLRRVRLLGR